MGIFDDLIPQKSNAGLFDDLIPAQALPSEPGTPALADMVARSFPENMPGSFPTTSPAPLIEAFNLPVTGTAPPPVAPNPLAQPMHGFMPDLAVQPPVAAPPVEQPASDYLMRAGRGLVEVPASLPEGAALLAARNQFNPQFPMLDMPSPDPIAENELFALGDVLRERAAETMGTPDPQFDDRFSSKLAEGAGNMAGFVATTLLTGPLGTVGAGAAVNAQQVYKEALAYGATEEDAMDAAGMAGLLGSSEAIPISRALQVLPERLRGEVANKVAKRFVSIFKSAGEEAAQEALVGVGNNIIALTNYDPERGTMDNVGEQALIGAILGGAVNVGGQAVDVMRNPEVPPVPPQIDPSSPEGLAALVQLAMDAAPVAPAADAPVGPQARPNQPEPPQQEELPNDPVDRGTDERGLAGVGAPVGVGGNTESAVTQVDNQAGGQDPAAVFATRRTGGAERAVGPVVDEGGVGAEPGAQRETDLNGAELPATEQAPADVPLPKAPETPQKKPLTSQFMRNVGPIDPRSDLAKELYGQDITPKTARGLFRNGGLMSLDNIPAVEHPEIAAVVGEDGNGYLDPVGLVDALIAEQREPAPIGRQAQVQDAYRAYEREIAAIEDGYDGVPEFDYEVPEGGRSWTIPDPNQDISTGVERIGVIEGALRSYEDQAGWSFTADERRGMVDYLDKRGGPVEAAIERVIVGDIGYGETGSRPSAAAASEVSATDQRNPARSEDTAGPQGRSATGTETDGPARQGTTEGGRVDQTPEGEQLVIPGAEQITDKERAERQQQAPKRGSDAPPPEGGLFDDDARNQQNLFEREDGKPAQSKRAVSSGTPDDSGSLKDAAARVGRRPTGRLAPSFLAFSYTTRASVFRHAFDAAGIDPDKGTLMPLDQQLRIVSQAVEKTFGITVELPTQKVNKKNRFGRKVTEERTSLSERKALDQLLNAYRQLQMLAHIMAIPEAAIGLPIDGKGITLSLTSGNRLKGALGMFSYGGGKRVISLPDMSNSFAHEWGHALDHYLGAVSDKPLLKGLLSRDGNLAGAPLSPKRALTEAFAHVIWSMYGKSGQAGAIVLQAQVESAQLGPDGKPTPKAKKAQKILTDIRAGKRPPMEYLSDYFKTSKAYDDQTGSDGYFTDPAEMFARAFEAMVGTEVAKVSDQPQAFLSKGEWAYTDSQDTRAALTFPKEVDLAHFTTAMVNLQQAMARINLFGPNAPAAAPANHDVLSTRPLLKRDSGTRIGNLKDSEISEWGRTIEMMGRLPTIAKEKGEAVSSGLSSFYSQVIRTGAATMFAVADSQQNPKAREAFTNIAKLLGKRPGRGGLVTSIWEETVRMKSGNLVNKIDGALRKSIAGRPGRRLTDADQKQLRKLLVGDKVANPDPKLERLAAELRSILNDIWYDLQAAGVKVGYASQYLPHIYDADKATANPKEFMARAAEVYDLMFQREVVDADPDAQLADMKSIFSGLMRATKALPDGDRAPAPRLSEDQAADVQAYFDDMREMAALEKKIGKLKTDKAKEKAEAQLAALDDGIESKRDEALEILREAWSEYSAENWLIRTRTGDLDDFGSIGPTAQFTKERVLPNEAGQIMADFMPQNPVEMITNYAFSAVKRAEYAKLFGADGEKLKNMLDAAEDASKEDVTMMKLAVNAATGRMQSSGSGMQAFKTTTFSLGNMSLLTLATMSSLAEPLTAGLRSGQSRDSLNALGQMVFNMVRRGRRQELQELARTIGLIMPYATDTLMQNRLGADVMQGQHWLQNSLSRFFILNGLTPLTHYQRAMQLPVANAVLLRHLRADVTGKRGVYGAWRDTIAGEKGDFANSELNELGIPKEDRAALLKWMDDLGGMPSAEDLYGPDGQTMSDSGALWARATYRFATETIQDPLKTDRAIQANNPDYAPMYGIMSFIDAFTRNVIWRTLERGVKEGDGKTKTGAKMTANAATALLPIGILFTGQMLASIVREAIFNSDAFMEKWESEDEDEWLEWIMYRGLDRTGLTGRLSPLINLYTGIRYDTDLTSIFAGPYAAFFLNNIADVIGASQVRNSPDNNTTEYAAARAFYQAMLKPAAVALIAGAAPMGALSVNGGRAALAYLSARTTEHGFAEGLVGEKGAKHIGERPWWEMGD